MPWRLCRRLGYREGDRVWIFAFPVDPSSLAADAYEVEGAMAYAGRGTEEDFAGVDLNGKIALIEGGGGVSLREKVEGAGEAGAEAAVIFNEEPNAWGILGEGISRHEDSCHRDRESGGARVVAGLGNGGQPGGEGLQIAASASAVPERRRRAEQ